MQMSELLGKIRTIGDKSPKPDQLPPVDEKSKAAGAGS
jgi:hypothetical protein